ncbi:ribosomal RNA-processing protein 8-like [Panonychus citri]|uniref:ribosomal RNA-processing protein 8-like n=1 Tax=Panonychus citri TaxID=50023 RepID=UPI0023080DB3|nr:ribosomal RNA-processing protein 8-like [Panonychus citri]XP_053210331.1 ribosomal RNA-processing protein 8-like [Panonychus citri]
MFKKKEKVTRSKLLAERCKKQMEYSRFRKMNEFIYSKPSDKGFDFMNDVTKFKQYHEAYDEIACKWPVKPVDHIIQKIESFAGPDWDKKWIIADLGCGQYPTIKVKLNKKAKVHSFDIISHHKDIIAANMVNVPLDNSSVDIAVYSLSLMATNIKDLMVEANRLLKKHGMLMIAEVSSRFEDLKIEKFEGKLKSFGFQIIEREYLPPNNFFVFINAVKKKNLLKQEISNLPDITLKPCLYKPR